MATRIPQRKIFEFLDYREFLLGYFADAKLRNHRFSLRTFSDHLGFKSKDFIHRVMKGEKNLSTASISQVSRGLELSAREALYFESLVYFCQSSSAEEREKHYARLQTQLKTIRFRESQLLLTHHQYQYYANWKHSAIRSLIGMQGFNGNYKELACKLLPKISAEDAKRSVTLLAHLGLISQKADGQWVLTRSAISSGDKVANMAMKTFHQECLQLARASIDNVTPHARNISGVTLGISPAKYAMIVERLNAFRKEIAMLAEDDDDADRVYQLNLQLFPMSVASIPETAIASNSPQKS